VCCVCECLFRRRTNCTGASECQGNVRDAATTRVAESALEVEGGGWELWLGEKFGKKWEKKQTCNHISKKAETRE
jgi:hypothetical protein